MFYSRFRDLAFSISSWHEEERKKYLTLANLKVSSSQNFDCFFFMPFSFVRPGRHKKMFLIHGTISKLFWPVDGSCVHIVSLSVAYDLVFEVGKERTALCRRPFLRMRSLKYDFILLIVVYQYCRWEIVPWLQRTVLAHRSAMRHHAPGFCRTWCRTSGRWYHHLTKHKSNERQLGPKSS